MSSDVELLQPSGDDPLIGTVLSDRYRIIRRLGEGGMGRVYEAEHVLIKRRVAIKCLHAQYASDPGVVARFHREALAATSIGNEHIVEVTDMGRFPDGAVYMALEFLDGRDLSHDLGDAGALTLGRAARILSQVCEAISAAHAKGIIHRDLKPENIFLIRRGTNRDFVKVVDFGISKFMDGDGKAMTGTGVMIGTPHYMAPEQVEGRKDIDHRVDLYALGVILFQMLTGILPIDAATIPKLVYEVCMVKAPSVRDLRPDLPVEVESLIAKLLEKEPSLRYPDADAVREALAPWLAVETPVGPIAAGRSSVPSGIRASSSRLSSPESLDATGVDLVRGTPIPPPARVAIPTDAPPMQSFVGPGVPASSSVIPASVVPSTAPVMAPAPAARAPRVEVMMGLTALMVLVSIGVGVGINNLNRQPPTAPAVAPVPTPVAAPVPTPVAAPAASAPPVPVPAAAPREVHVTIRVRPDDALLTMDGSRVPAPYNGTLDVGVHDIEVARDGYRTLLLRRVAIRNEQTIELQLQRGHGHHRGPVEGQLATDDAGVSHVELIDATATTHEGARSPVAPGAGAATEQAPSQAATAPTPTVQPGRTTIDEPF